MESVKDPDAVNWTGNVDHKWRLFKQRFMLYLQVIGLDSKPEVRKIALLLTVAGPQALEDFNTFVFAEAEDQGKFNKVIEMFDEHCSPKKNETFESLDQVIAANPGKTPISLLQEYCTKNSKIPKYELVKSEGQDHLPNFTFRASVGEVMHKGQGQSKKAAKHKAAAAVLNILNGGTAEDTVYDGISYALQDPEPITSSKQPQNLPNLVGALQELVLQKGWRLPDYSIAEELGPPSKREFAIVCKVETFVETGCGTSKKLAKRAAATKMIAKLQSMPAGWNGGEEFEIEGISLSNLKLERAHKSGSRWNGSRGKVLVCTWDLIRKSPGEKINQLKRSPLSIPNTDYIQMLREVALEQAFDVTYLDIDELTVNGQYQCMAELSTLPITVCHGTGISRGNAHNEAAHNALQYMKIMAGRN